MSTKVILKIGLMFPQQVFMLHMLSPELVLVEWFAIRIKKIMIWDFLLEGGEEGLHFMESQKTTKEGSVQK